MSGTVEKSLKVIPAVTITGAAGGTVDLAALSRISVREAEVLEIVELFRESVSRLAAVVLPEAVVESTGPPDCLRIELDGVTGGVFGRTQGIRADDRPLDDERCRIVVGDEGVLVQAPAGEGVHRALTSLVQLAALGDGVLPRGTIDDCPGLSWRGLSIDVVRTFVPVEQIKRVIDMLSLYKLNVLHVHLTDNEGWRLQIRAWPRLTEVGGVSARGDRSGGYYTQAEFRELVEYATSRFVTIVPEIDLPGHSKAAIAAHPEFAVPGSAEPNLDPDSAVVWRFVEDVLGEVAALCPSAFIHIGGDEAFGMTDDDHARFVDGVVAITKRLGKRVVGWQEACRASLGEDDVVQYWIDFGHGLGTTGERPSAPDGYPPEVVEIWTAHFRKAREDAERITAKQLHVVLSPTSHAYLDRPHGDRSLVPDQDGDRSRLGFQAYPATTLGQFFDWEPLRAVSGIDSELVAGVEGAVWCETVESMDDLELLLLPRLPGLAERAWSPSLPAAWEAHRGRLGEHARIWRRAGWEWYRADTIEWADEYGSA